METNVMTPEKSLQIINEAIEKSRKDFEKNAGSPMIIWGVVVLIFSIAIWLLLTMTGNLNWNFLWFGIPAAGFPLCSIVLKDKCKAGGESFISKTLGQIWTTYGVFATILSAVFAFTAPQYTGYTITVLLGFAATMTGFILKDRYIIAGGFITGLGCTIALLFSQNEFVPLYFSAASILNLIIPGIMMNQRAK